MAAKSFKEQHTFERRTQEAERMFAKYPDRIPVICEKDPKSSIAPMDKQKFLVPQDITVGQFVCTIRKRVNLSSEEAIFLCVNNILPLTSDKMSEVYEKHKDADGFIYLSYSGEATFGQ